MAEITEAAAARAEELGLDPHKIEGSGKDGRVTKDDVEKAATDEAGFQEVAQANAVEPEESFTVLLNPELPSTTRQVNAGGRVFVGGETVSASEWETLKEAKGSPSVEHPDGVPLLQKEGDA